MDKLMVSFFTRNSIRKVMAVELYGVRETFMDHVPKACQRRLKVLLIKHCLTYYYSSQPLKYRECCGLWSEVIL
jgi:hypothetical protein